MHQPVMVDAVIGHMAVRRGGRYVDGTAGSGGHTAAMLRVSAPDGLVLAMDRDAEAVSRLKERFRNETERCTVVQAAFSSIAERSRIRGWESVDGVLLDIGVSSEQLDVPSRGFSFGADGPLDMRMDRGGSLTAETIVNTWPEEELADIVRRLGEERRARRIASAIAAARRKAPIRTTLELSRIVETAAGGRRGRLHPATKTFQALRMTVNDELGELERGLSEGLAILAPGGRMAVIAFHSLEDRMVKQFMVRHAGRWESLPAGGREWRGEEPRVERVTRKPVTPDADEVRRNPRARSAKLRVAQRLA